MSLPTTYKMTTKLSRREPIAVKETKGSNNNECAKKKQTSIMIWGGIDSSGYRIQLIKFSEHVNKITYKDELAKKQNL